MTRPAGTPNKNKRSLKAELKKKYGAEFDVIMMMAENCQTLHGIAQTHKTGKVSFADQETIDASSSAVLANNALEKLAQYVEPKLKAIEISGELSMPTVIRKDLSGESE